MLLKTEEKEMLMKVKQLAEALKVSERQVWKLRSSGRLPEPVRLGRSVRWRRNEIEAWIRAGCPAIDKWQPPG